MSIAVKVVLHNNEKDELELGPFNQGVLIEPPGVIDLATKRLVVTNVGGRWTKTGEVKWFDKLFIHAMQAPAAMAAQLARDQSLYGYCVVDTHGQRLHPRSIIPAVANASMAECVNVDRDDPTWSPTVGDVVEVSKTVEAVDNDWRSDPRDGNSFALKERRLSTYMVTITDCFGGHETTISRSEWESWPKLELGG